MKVDPYLIAFLAVATLPWLLVTLILIRVGHP